MITNKCHYVNDAVLWLFIGVYKSIGFVFLFHMQAAFESRPPASFLLLFYCMLSMRISKWHYVYVLLSQKDGNFYIGYTKNTRRRITEHNAKKNFPTKGRLPFALIYIEMCTNKEDAERRENYLKTTQGRRFLKLRLRKFLNS